MGNLTGNPTAMIAELHRVRHGLRLGLPLAGLQQLRWRWSLRLLWRPPSTECLLLQLLVLRLLLLLLQLLLLLLLPRHSEQITNYRLPRLLMRLLCNLLLLLCRLRCNLLWLLCLLLCNLLLLPHLRMHWLRQLCRLQRLQLWKLLRAESYSHVVC
jgi:hypothetical protein